MINFGDDKIFIENYKRLKSSRKMGELYHCDKKSITTHAKKIGYDFSKNKEVKIANIPIETIIQEYEELGSTRAVGELHGCSSTTVARYLKANGYALQSPKAKLADVSNDDFIKAYDELGSAEKVGKKFNCSDTAVLNHAKKIGYIK
jgi:beta-lactam-binding protein with PASTA domain